MWSAFAATPLQRDSLRMSICSRIEPEADPDHVKRSVAAGLDAKEHLGLCATRANGSVYSLNDVLIYDDIVQLFRAARIGVVPTISYVSLAARMNEQPKMLEGDAELAPFIAKDSFGWMIEMKPDTRERIERAAQQARISTARLARAGITIGTGTDIWQIPTGVHLELEELVASGVSPAQAIRAATSGSSPHPRGGWGSRHD